MLTFDEFTAVLTAAEAEFGPPEPPAPLPAAARAASAKSGDAEVATARSALQHLIQRGELDLGEYGQWQPVAMALKHSLGEPGFDPFHELSAAARGYQGEADCRKTWDSVGEPPDKPLTMATYFARAKASGWTPPRRTGNGEGGRKNEKAPDPAIVAVKLALEAGDRFWVDLDGRPHVSTKKPAVEGGIPVDVHLRIDGFPYRQILAARYVEHFGDKVLSDEQEKRAVKLLQYRAQQSGERHLAYMRFGEHDGNIYVDLGRSDGQCVKVDGEGWRIVGDVPMRFVRGSRSELPIPESGGTLADFAVHFNLVEPGIKLLIGFLLSCFKPGFSKSFLFFEGEAGSGKSGYGDKTISLGDPPGSAKNARFSLSPDERNLHVHASHAAILFFDNLSSLSAQQADVLCRLVTGAASSYRVHQTMDEEQQFTLLRPVVATCISMPSNRGDFLNRCITVTAKAIEKRLPEEMLWNRFEADRPKLLGFLLTGVSYAIRNKERVQRAVEAGEIELPRLADVAAFVEGAAELLELKPGEFSAMLRKEQTGLQAEAAMSDPIVAGLVAYFAGQDSIPLDRSSTELLALLKKAGDPAQKWPPSNRVRDRLIRNRAALRALGIEVEDYHVGGKTNIYKYRITKTEAFSAAAPLPPADDQGEGEGDDRDMPF